MRLTTRQRARIRWWRDQARPITLSGLGVYALGFFLGWMFELELSGVVERLGLVIAVAGGACGLLWLVDTQDR